MVKVRAHRRRGTHGVRAHNRRKGKVHYTENYERHRILEPRFFVRGSLRTHDIGRRGYSKRIAGRLKMNRRWATQSLLISRKEPPKMKYYLRIDAMRLQTGGLDLYGYEKYVKAYREPKLRKYFE